MPFLPPNQQRQSTGGKYRLHCTWLLAAGGTAGELNTTLWVTREFLLTNPAVANVTKTDLSTHIIYLQPHYKDGYVRWLEQHEVDRCCRDNIVSRIAMACAGCAMHKGPAVRGPLWGAYCGMSFWFEIQGGPPSKLCTRAPRNPATPLNINTKTSSQRLWNHLQNLHN